MMEVVATGERAGGGQHPFQRRNVQEWSRLDELTGMLEHARVETDHWAASTSNSSHHFGKVVDSRSRNLADGGKEQRQQTKQLEVFQANIPGGSLQVIRSQSVTSTSSSWHGQHKISSSRWNSNNNEVPTLPSIQNKEFDNLKLALNPLDLSSQKTKASVGRSGSIGSRRPPSRPRSIVSLKHDDIISEDKEANRLSELSRITHQIHQEAKEKLFSNLETTSMHRHLSNGLNRTKYDYDENDTNDFPYSLEGRCNVRNSSVHEIAKSSSESTISSSHHSLTRKKSCSSEDLHHNEEDKKTDDIGSDKLEWNRSSKVRRSLQFPLKPNTVQKEIPVVPLTKSVSQIKEEIEARKQIVSSVLKGNQWNNLGELEGVLGVVSNGHDGEPIPPSSPKKRQSFITVESLKEVRGRLRKLSTSTDDAIRSEEPDDGIVTEVKSNSPVLDKIEDTSKNSVKSYVFGMETVLRSAKPVLGTGSLESRSSNKTNGNGNNRTEEWYNRRKSYGFEQVNGQQSNHSNMPIEKSKVDSSTDSGICRSSETMAFPSWVKPIVIDRSDTDDGNKLKTSHSIVIKQFENENERHINKEKFKSEIESGTVIPTGRKTVVTLGSNNYSQSNWNWNTNNEETQNNNDDKKETVTKGKIADALRKLREKSTSFESHRLSEPITISIPIQHSHPQITDPKLLLLKQTKETEKSEVTPSASLKGQNMTSYSHLLYGHNTNENDTDLSNENIKENGDILRGQTNRTKTLSNWFDSELKRHSIAVDDAKYITNRSKSYGSNYFQENHDRKISLPTNNDMKENPGQVNNTSGHLFLNSGEKDPNKYSGESDYELNGHEKKQKRVEFCKTEVHFAAEPGRFNIVETDGKPPPSNMYRRRKKTITETTNRTGLPEIRFGDSQYEKHLLTSNENNEFDSDPKVKPLTFRGSPVFQDGEKEDIVTFAQNNTTATSSCTYLSDSSQEEQKIIEPQIYSEDETPRPRSILKNNIPKPRPFLLGENDNIQEPLWGVKLKSVNENDKVIEVTSNDNDNIPITTKETEFQKLLRSLRPATHKSSDFERSLVESSSIAADNGLEVRISSSTALPDQRRASWSVADRIRHVEDLRTKGYLTKVNFGIGEAVVIGSKTEEQPKISCYESDTPNSWYKREQHFAKDKSKQVLLHVDPEIEKPLTYSHSFTGTKIALEPSKINRIQERFLKDDLKSTSLVMQIQNPALYCDFYELNSLGKEDKIESNNSTQNPILVEEKSKNILKIKNNYSKISKHCVEDIYKNDNFTGNCLDKELNVVKQKNDNLKLSVDAQNKLIEYNVSYIDNMKINPLYIEDEKDSLEFTVSNNFPSIGQSKDQEEGKNGITGVLDVLDDLSRCIDEVIIEFPRKINIVHKTKDKVHNNKNVFQIIEGSSDSKILQLNNCSKRENLYYSKQNERYRGNDKEMVVSSQLDLLKEILDPGEISEDSLKADEEVRTYMSTGDDEDDDTMNSELSGSWSKMRTFRHISRETSKRQAKEDAVVSTLNNRVLPFVPQVSHAQGIETTFNNRPKVTSISLNYEKPMTQLPVTIFSQPTQQTTNTVKTTSDLEIIGNVEQSENGTRIWSFSKSSSSPIERKSPLKPTNDNYSLQKSEQKIISQTSKVEHLDETNTNIEIRPSHLSNRKPLSPSKDILLVQKAEDKNVKLSDTNRHSSLSPSIPLKRSQKKYNEDSAEKTSQTEPEYVNIKKDVKATQTSYRQISNSQAYNRSTRDKIKKDSIKSNECNKLVNDSKRKERKLSTSSSGRDGWLNTPKEPQARQKSDTHHRKVEVKKENHLSTNVIKQNNVKRIQNGSESPIYQNREVYAVKKDATDRSETESAILEELTKAADQILLAVNGYTDDDSFKGSSDDEYRKRHGREKIISKPLCTISETPNKKITNTNYRRTSQITTQRTRTAEIHKDQRAVPKPRIAKTSSNSSMDSGPPEVRPLLTSEDRSKRRAARLLQRANSRELLLQTGASSSEDIGSGSEAGNVRTKQRIVRRTRAQGTRSSTSTQQTAISHRSTTTASESRTRERVQRSIANSDKTSSKKQVISRRTKGDEKLSNHLRPITGSAGPVKCERAERRSLTMSSSLQPSNVSSKKKSYTSQSEESTKSRE